MAMRNKVPKARNPFQSNTVGGATFTVGAEAANVRKVTVQLTDENGKALNVRGQVMAYLSDDAHGDTIAANAPTGGWAIAVNGLLIPLVANKAAHFVSEADGKFDVNITDTGTRTWFLIVQLPDGSLVSSAAVSMTTTTTTTTAGS